MITYAYSAVDARGKTTSGTVQVADQIEALQRLKEMGFFPTKVTPVPERSSPAARSRRHVARLGLRSRANTGSAPSKIRLGASRLTVLTRQLATLLEAGLPLLRGLRLLHEQETHPPLRRLLTDLTAAIEAGRTFSEALAEHPAVFNRLYVNMVRAGELGGMLEVSLLRLADFMEKAGKIKRKVKAAMLYPAAVLVVAVGIMALLLVFVIPRFKEVFAGLTGGKPLPAFTQFVIGLSEGVQAHFLLALATLGGLAVLFAIARRTRPGRRLWDGFKLTAPVFGPLFRKLAIARFARTLGTLITSGVPILQALTIVREATGNLVVGRLVGEVHENVKQGESIVGPLRSSGIFPAMIAGMVDVGEQTGALPEMLNRIADTYDDEVDTSVAAMTSLLEPILIIFLAVVVGSVVIAMFLPIIGVDPTPGGNPADNG